MLKHRLTASLCFLLAALAAYWGLLIYQLGAQWSAYEQYNYGWAVPFLCGYLLWQRVRATDRSSEIGDGSGQSEDNRSKIEERRVAVGDASPTALTHSPSPLRWARVALDFPQRGARARIFQFPTPVFYLLFASLALVWLLARWLHEANPIWRLTSWVLAFVVVALTLLCLRVVQSAAPLRHERGEGGVRCSILPQASALRLPSSAFRLPLSAFSFSALVFPICFFLVAVPWPSGLEGLLTQSFMRANTAVTTELLSFLGIPAMQRGNVIEIATGLVGVDEACSGIRSFQATLMIGLFLGELYRLSVLRRSVLCLLGFALAFIFNIGRTLLLVYVASRDGIKAIAKWHDPAGVTILVGCFLGLWAIGGALRRKRPSPPRSGREQGEVSNLPPSQLSTSINQPLTPTSPLPSSPSALHPPPSAFRITRLAPFLAAWFIFTEVVVGWWYRSHENFAGAHANWSLNLGDANSGYTRVTIPPNIAGQFNADESTEAQWRDRDGNSWQLFYFRWLPSWALKRRVAVQLAKTHGPEKCLPAAGMKLKSDLGSLNLRVADAEFVFHQYEFTAEGRSIHVFYAIYEDPTGGTVLANRRQNSAARVAAAVAGSRNYGQRFLEIAVSGNLDAAQAGLALNAQLEKLLSQERGTRGQPGEVIRPAE